VEDPRGGHLAALVHDILDVAGGMHHAQKDLLPHLPFPGDGDAGGLHGDDGPDPLLHVNAKGQCLSDPIVLIDFQGARRRLEVFPTPGGPTKRKALPLRSGGASTPWP